MGDRKKMSKEDMDKELNETREELNETKEELNILILQWQRM
jgi:hypothetical protein